MQSDIHERVKRSIVAAWPEARRVRRDQVDEY
jgi:hypothetical protein